MARKTWIQKTIRGIPVSQEEFLAAVIESVALNPHELKRYSQHGEVITDDNQLLAYGKALHPSGLLRENFELLRRINPKIVVSESIDSDFE